MSVKRKTFKPSMTSLQFLDRLTWLDGRPLLDTIEPYRRRIFELALDTYGPDGRPKYGTVLAGRAKKNGKSLDEILAGLYCVTIRRSPQGQQAFLIANDLGQANDDLELLKKLIEVNPILRSEFEVLSKEVRLRDGSGALQILPAGDADGLHGKSYAFIGYDEIHAYRDWSIIEALQPDPHRAEALQWFTSYDSIENAKGTPLFDLKELGRSGKDPRMLYSWYSGDECTDPDFAHLPPRQRANPSMANFEVQDYLDRQFALLPTNIFNRLHLNLPGTISTFLDMGLWDECVDPKWRMVTKDRKIGALVGLDIGIKNDYTAIVVVYFRTHDQEGGARLPSNLGATERWRSQLERGRQHDPHAQQTVPHRQCALRSEPSAAHGAATAGRGSHPDGGILADAAEPDDGRAEPS
jgi:phage terminase large subunit-like protein